LLALLSFVTGRLYNGKSMSVPNRFFGKRNPQSDFARHMPVLAEAGHNISLGIYWRLSKRYEKESREVDPYKLAYAVVYDLTQNESGTRSLGDFPVKNQKMIVQEANQAAKDDEIRHALALEYAGRLMALSWNSGRPFSEEYVNKAKIITEKATELGFPIDNIVSHWGSKAVVNLQGFAKKFRQENS
jgi:hypothetical protein